MVFEYDGVKLAYDISGEGDRTVLLLHGWGGSRKSWLPVERDLKPDMRVINLDFPGFGESTEPNRPWSVTEYRDITLALIDHLKIDSLELIAHSFGGRVALMLNEARPLLVSKQVLTGCAGLVNRDAQGGGMAHRLSKVYDNALSRRLLGEKGVDKIKNAVRSHFGSEDYKNASPMMRECFKLVVNQNLGYCLSGIKASTLLIWGRNDTATPLWMGERMEREIDDSALIVFENSGHFAYLEQYARFIAIVKQFL
ncbi:MAG: alpha/beta hydrolase [Clostridia bacterium]|nr:alpha/beta hydrolase [Clostridia bacterium]